MIRWSRILMLAVLLVFSSFSFVRSEADIQRRLVVGTKVAPPFSVKNEQGIWSGMSIELWRVIAAEAGFSYEFEERNLAGLLEGLRDGSLDTVVAALTITGPREEQMDITHSFHSSGLGIAVLRTTRGAGCRFWNGLFPLNFSRESVLSDWCCCCSGFWSGFLNGEKIRTSLVVGC